MSPQHFRTAVFSAALVASLYDVRPPVGPLPWRFVTEHIIAPPEGSKGELGDIASLALADDGTVYAMQKSPTTVLVFGPDGKYLRKIGREGDGPGELRSGVIGVKDNLLMVQDWRAQRFTIFRTNGAVVKTIPSVCCQSYGTLHIDSSGRAWAAGPIQGGKTIYLRINSRGQVIDSIPQPATILGRTWEARAINGSVRVQHTVVVPGEPFEITALRYDGLMLRGRSDSMRFVLSRNGRDTVKIFEAPTTRLPVSISDKHRIIEEMIELLPSQAIQDAMRKVAKVSDIPARSNAWHHVLTDRVNRTWVSLPTGKDGVGQYGVFDPTGKYLGEVSFPATRGLRLLAMGRDRVAVLEDGDSGLPQIRVYKLIIGVQ